MFSKFFKKESPLAGLAGLGGGFSLFKSGGVSGPLTASGSSGSTSFPQGGFTNVVFTAPGTLTITGGADYLQYLVVAGGGGSPSNGPGGAPGGGGGGGYRTNVPGQGSGGGASAESATGVFVSPGTITVEVGAGGTAAQGSPSWFGPSSSNKLIESIGGGKGARYNDGTAGPGGSGGGGRKANSGSGNGGSGTPGQGYDGAPGSGSTRGGGGGGAGGTGSGSNGGIGQRATWVPSSYGTSGPQPGRYFAAGGGGHDTGVGGNGGGGNWGNPGTNGAANTGGGAGGNEPNGNNTTGGSGIVILRFAE